MSYDILYKLSICELSAVFDKYANKEIISWFRIVPSVPHTSLKVIPIHFDHPYV